MLKDVSSTSHTLKRLAPTSPPKEEVENFSPENSPLKKHGRKKHKHRHKKDKNYKPGMSLDGNKKKEVNNENIRAMRSDNSTTLPTGEEIKHHAVIKPSFFNDNPDLKPREDEIINKFKKMNMGVKTNRNAVITQVSATGTPLKGETTTPSKTPLDNPLRFGNALVILSNNPNSIHTPVTTIDLNSPFFKSEQFKAIKKALENFKEQRVEVNSALLKKSAKENELVSGRNQAQEMVNKGYSAKLGSATQYAKATNITELDIPCEWMHLLAYFLMGQQSQNENNLVCGSKEANTLMTYVESQYKYLAKTYSSFTLKIRVDLIPNTQIATTITMTLSTPDNVHPHFEMTIYIDGQTHQKPHVVIGQYFENLIKTLGEDYKKECEKQVVAKI